MSAVLIRPFRLLKLVSRSISVSCFLQVSPIDLSRLVRAQGATSTPNFATVSLSRLRVRDVIDQVRIYVLNSYCMSIERGYH